MIYTVIENNIKFIISTSDEYFQINAHLLNTSYNWSIKFTDSFNITSKKEESLIYIFTLQ